MASVGWLEQSQYGYHCHVGKCLFMLFSTAELELPFAITIDGDENEDDTTGDGSSDDSDDSSSSSDTWS